MIPRLLSVKAAAAALGLSEMQLYRLIYAKRISHRRTGSRIRFTEGDLIEFVERQKVAAASSQLPASPPPQPIAEEFAGAGRYRH